jgi:hypothetical protein
MKLPKVYKPIIKTKQISFSETIFPNLYKKKKVVYDDFSKIYLTNIKDFKELNTQMTQENTNILINKKNNDKYTLNNKLNIKINNYSNNNKRNNSKDKHKNLNSKYLNTFISKRQSELSNSSSSYILGKDTNTINTRFMYSYNSNKSKRNTLFNSKSKYSLNNNINDENTLRIKVNDLNLCYNSIDL